MVTRAGLVCHLEYRNLTEYIDFVLIEGTQEVLVLLEPYAVAKLKGFSTMLTMQANLRAMLPIHIVLDVVLRGRIARDAIEAAFRLGGLRAVRSFV